MSETQQRLPVTGEVAGGAVAEKEGLWVREEVRREPLLVREGKAVKNAQTPGVRRASPLVIWTMGTQSSFLRKPLGSPDRCAQLTSPMRPLRG